MSAQFFTITVASEDDFATSLPTMSIAVGMTIAQAVSKYSTEYGEDLVSGRNVYRLTADGATEVSSNYQPQAGESIELRLQSKSRG